MSKNLPIIGVVEPKYPRNNYQLGIAYFERNLFFKKSKSLISNKLDCWAVYKVKPYTYNNIGRRKQLNIHNNLTRMFWDIQEEFHLVDVPKTTSIVEVHENLKSQSSGVFKRIAVDEIDLMTEVIVDWKGDSGNSYETYLMIKLDIPNFLFRNLKEFAASLFQDPARIINRISGMDVPEIYKREYEMIQSVEKITREKINRRVKISEATGYDTIKLIKTPFYFGIGEPRIEGTPQNPWRPDVDLYKTNKGEVIRPKKRSILKLTECDINIGRPREVKIKQFHKGVEKAAYQSYIAVTDIPDTYAIGGEWLNALKETLTFPVYTSIRGKVLNNKIAKDELNKKQREIRDNKEHISTNQEAEVPLDVYEQEEAAYLMENEMKVKKFPLIVTTLIIAVAAETLEELHIRVDAVRSRLDPIPTEVPAGDQWLMFNEALIGGEQYLTDYKLRLHPEQLALLRPGASTEIGDEKGFYLGVTGALNKSVYLSPDEPSRQNKPPNATFTGSQGGGKSFTCDLIALYTVKFMNSKGLWIDPKGDRKDWPKDLETFGDEVFVTTFTSSENDRGKLDPYIIARDGRKRNELKTHEDIEVFNTQMRDASILALDIVMFLSGIKRDDARLPYLLEAAEATEKTNAPCLTNFIEALSGEIYERAMADEDIQKANYCKQLASTLTSFKHMAFAALLFGREDDVSISLEKRVNVLQIQNLVFPEEGKKTEDFSFQELIGYACLLAITGYVKRYIMYDRSQLKLFVMDEATVFNNTPAGKNALNTINRMARALNCPGYFIGQSVSDIGDKKARNNIGYKFAFKSDEIQEIDDILNYFGLEKSEEIVERISELQTGECLFQDHYGRTGFINIDVIFEEYSIALDTNPASKKVRKEAQLVND